MPNTLIAENIVVAFRNKPVLNGVTLRSEQGKITGLLGRNGSGKTTLLKAIFGTQAAPDKILQVNRQTIKKELYAQKGMINYMPQYGFLPKNSTVEKVLKDFNIIPGAILVDFPELADDINRKVKELSVGIERLWSIMILLFANTAFTLLDEPFTHIMPLHLERLKQVLQREKQRKGIIITDHMYRHVVEIADSLQLIKDGNNITVLSKEDLVFHQYINRL